jgi:ABC-type nitrate/sulfonate/bicarbonate transport system substrate-binding protein
MANCWSEPVDRPCTLPHNGNEREPGRASGGFAMAVNALSARALALAIGVVCLASAAPDSVRAEVKKLIFAVPGVPPIFASLIAHVAAQESLFKKFGSDVEVRNVESGTTGARAVVAGDVDLSLSPSPLIVNQISNADVDLVGIYGLPNPSFLLASTDTNATCKDVAGQPVGVDAIGGARANALAQMIVTCGLKLDDVKQVALPSTATQQSMIASVIRFGVLHFDEIPVVEGQGKPIKVVLTLNDVNKDSHFAMVVVRRAHLQKYRESYVRALAAVVTAARFMADPRNAERFGEIAARPGRTKEEAMAALRRFVAIGYWPTDADGLDRGKLEAVIAPQVNTGGIRPGKPPVSYERLVDPTVWNDAVALIGKSS